MTRPPEIHMIRVELETAALFRLGRRRRLPDRQTDLGYLVHCQLRELFGDQAPQPFALSEENARRIEVLGYADVPAASLREAAHTFADPAAHASCAWDTLASKTLPTEWTAGRRLGFQVRVCPVVRMASDGDHHRKGAEVDAFLARCWRVGRDVPVDREAVYRDWLSSQLERHGGARLETTRLLAFDRERLVRRRQTAKPRPSAVVERPSAQMEGTLAVSDGERFGSLLRRGIGRHRSFGFGMLLLRPVRAASC